MNLVCDKCGREITTNVRNFGSPLPVKDGRYAIEYYKCPNLECSEMVIIGKLYKGSDKVSQERRVIHPKVSPRGPLPKEIPPEFSADYLEACLILNDSPKASATLSRRCLQHLLVEKAGAKGNNLAKDIDHVLESGNLPSHIKDNVDAIRNFGIFGAHTSKNESTGEIIDVEPGEAEWLLEILEELFDLYFVQLPKSAQRRKGLNNKLKAAGKKSMKTPPPE